MQLIDPSVILIDEKDPFKKIEMAARTCYAKDTEILTDSGFKFVEDITSDDNVLTYNTEKNMLEYQPSNMVKYKFTGKMIQCNHRFVPFAVTPDHRMFVSRSYARNYHFVEAKHLIDDYYGRTSKYRIPKWFLNAKRDNDDFNEMISVKTTVNIGRGRTVIKEVSFPVSDELLTLLGAYITEGSTFHGESYRTSSRVLLYQTFGTELYTRIQDALERLTVPYIIRSDPRKPMIKRFIIHGQPMVNFFETLCGHLSRNKHLPYFFRKLSDRQLQLLLKILYLGDGSHNKTRHDRYLSISKQLLSEVQEIFILLGKNATAHFDEIKAQYCYTEDSLRDSWIITKENLSFCDYDDYVYCPSTDNGIVCIRYHSQSMWCGNCYKSEASISDESAKKMFKRLADSQHTAMMEHATFVFQMCDDMPLVEEIALMACKYLNVTHNSRRVLVSGNLRAINESKMPCLLNALIAYDPMLSYEQNTTIPDPLGVTAKIIDFESLPDKSPAEIAAHRYTTMRFITDRGVSHEAVRHRPFSFAQESTRYVNYSAEKFGGGNIKFIKPADFDKWTPERQEHFKNALCSAEQQYNEEIALGATAQEARAVLPNAVKTELVITGNDKEWQHFFNLRAKGTTGKPHPDMQLVANIAMEIYRTKYKE